MRRRASLTGHDIREMTRLVVSAALPGREMYAVRADHPYTTDGLQIDVRSGCRWAEIGECEWALPALLEDSGLNSGQVSGLTMGLGLDRALMLRKGIEDIRLLRSTDPRGAGQLLNRSPYCLVSSQPSILRGLSVTVDGNETPEELCDGVRGVLGEHSAASRPPRRSQRPSTTTSPVTTVARLGISPEKRTCWCGIVLRDPRVRPHARRGQ